MPVLVGAGAVGLALGARLARAGCEVLLVARHPAVVRAIEEHGIRYEDPASGEAFVAPARCCLGPAAAVTRLAAAPALVCTRASDTEEAARSIASVAPFASVVSAQNDVDNEERLARHFPRVLGMVVRQTCTRVAANSVRALGPGRLVLGAHPSGSGPDVDSLAVQLRAAGYDVGISAHIHQDKWLKLCINLMSAPNALVRPEDHMTRAFVETKARLLEEASAVLAAAGIIARSCDGRDRSVDEEIAFQRASLATGTSARRLPVYNQIWAALRERRALEGDRYHRRIVELGRRHEVATPMNVRVLDLLEAAYREGLGPECLSASELFSDGG